VWLGRVLDEETNAEVLAWVLSGGPGRAALPEGLKPHVTRPFLTRQKAAAVEGTAASTR
jgi:hypothetical protein